MNKKTKLTYRQQERIERNHAKKLQQPNNDDATEINPNALSKGRVISRYGKSAEVESESKACFRCKIRRTLPAVVTGDYVLWAQQESEQSGIIEAILPRESLFSRPDFYDGMKPIAANIDQIIVISAIEPTFSLDIIDRYLVACETLAIKPIIALNKTDLIDAKQSIIMDQQLAVYRSIGYQVLYLSIKDPASLNNLQQQLNNNTTIFVGQSGVGKSSLLLKLIPEFAKSIEVNVVSARSNLGQHTTTRSQLYHLPKGGDVIDSPGVREFGLWHLNPAEITLGFIEFRPYLADCYFRDCQHHANDARCGLVKAVKRGDISQQRFDSYQHILKNLPPANERRGLKSKKRAPKAQG